jgi:hypothetical protein
MSNHKPTLRGIATAIHALVNRANGDVIETGRLLAAAREQADHGKWLGWLKGEFGWSYRTAARFIAAYQWAEKQPFQIRQIAECRLSQSALYIVASGIDAKAERQILKLAAKRRVTASMAKAIVEKLKPQPENAASLPEEKREDQDLIAALKIIDKAARKRSVAGKAVQTDFTSVDLLFVAEFISSLATEIGSDDPVKQAADRAEARSRRMGGNVVSLRPVPAGEGASC